MEHMPLLISPGPQPGDTQQQQQQQQHQHEQQQLQQQQEERGQLMGVPIKCLSWISGELVINFDWLCVFVFVVHCPKEP